MHRANQLPIVPLLTTMMPKSKKVSVMRAGSDPIKHLAGIALIAPRRKKRNVIVYKSAFAYQAKALCASKF